MSVGGIVVRREHKRWFPALFVLAGDADMDVIVSGDVQNGEAGPIECRLRSVDGWFDLVIERLEFGHRLSSTYDVHAFFKRDEKGFAGVDEVVVGILYFGGWVEVLCAVDEVARDTWEADQEIFESLEVGFVGKCIFILREVGEQRLGL